ncbi:MAG: helix-turn-helix transcriptional regulator [Bacteroidota bacterium]|nr:helix-turn-helix transcriptional regulator [Bacteroidota bacterium]MDP4233317.1 helix-turn-helix transcriptional regulator [Bacteroidota bacterium]MDP4242063.1 helix-turn-helix transcriptional regulator [Bacteroidota bacterium]MDP4288659.1 helix-turn-helix transcriptional regulator [Bacteroidota bacterium]
MYHSSIEGEDVTQQNHDPGGSNSQPELLQNYRTMTPGTLVSMTPRRSAIQRRHHRRNLDWEQVDLASNGLYARNLEELEARFPALSLMELRVCALAKAMLTSSMIAELLGICTKTVENHLRSVRIKLGLPPGTKLHTVFSTRADPVDKKNASIQILGDY